MTYRIRGLDPAPFADRFAMEDDVNAAIRDLLKDEDIAYIDAHNAKHGCFAARIERYEEH